MQGEINFGEDSTKAIVGLQKIYSGICSCGLILSSHCWYITETHSDESVGTDFPSSITMIFSLARIGLEGAVKPKSRLDDLQEGRL